MKKWQIFVSGALAGIFLTMIFVFVIGHATTNGGVGEMGDDTIKMFDKPGSVINESSLEVFQVLEEHAALVRGTRSYDSPVYLIVNNNNEYYYDDERIKVPEGTELRQVGIYHYMTKDKFLKTVPVIMILMK